MSIFLRGREVICYGMIVDSGKMISEIRPRPRDGFDVWAEDHRHVRELFDLVAADLTAQKKAKPVLVEGDLESIWLVPSRATSRFESAFKRAVPIWEQTCGGHFEVLEPIDVAQSHILSDELGAAALFEFATSYLIVHGRVDWLEEFEGLRGHPPSN